MDPFLEAMADLMQRQFSSPPPVLSRRQLQDLGFSLKKVCYHMQSLGIQDSLGHCDLNPGNIIVGEHRSVFIDLAEAYVGPPFPTFEYLRLIYGNRVPHLEQLQ